MALNQGIFIDDNDDDEWGMYSSKTPSLGPPYSPRQRILSNGRNRALLIAVTLVLAFLYWITGYGQRTGNNHSSSSAASTTSPPTDWSRFAYVQYATDVQSMCNVFMVFESLHRLGSKADRVLLYPQEWTPDANDEDDRAGQLLARAVQLYGVKLYPTQILGVDGPLTPGTLNRPSDWQASMTKLRIFELEDYERVLYFDSDVLLQQHLDELFLLPRTPAAMTRRYWLGDAMAAWQWPLSGILMLIEPNVAEMDTLWERLQSWRLLPERADDRSYDDDLLDDRFHASALVLPHRPYVLQTSEFRRRSHDEYMGTLGGPRDGLQWNAKAEVQRAKIIHFDDWPLPKPWIMWPTAGVAELQPDCGRSHTSDTCEEREVWKGLYDQFRQRRRDLCMILSVPAPQDWKDYKMRIGAL